jgi:putative flippase GtrA
VTLTFVRFLLVGGAGVVVNSLALFVFYQLLGLPLIFASAVAVELAIAHNFVWNDRWTFGSASLSLLRFFKFNLVSLAGLLLTTATAWLLVEQADINYLLANLVGISLAVTCNFAANTAWTWRGSVKFNQAPTSGKRILNDVPLPTSLSTES